MGSNPSPATYQPGQSPGMCEHLLGARIPADSGDSGYVTHHLQTCSLLCERGSPAYVQSLGEEKMPGSRRFLGSASAAIGLFVEEPGGVESLLVMGRVLRLQDRAPCSCLTCVCDSCTPPPNVSTLRLCHCCILWGLGEGPSGFEVCVCTRVCVHVRVRMRVCVCRGHAQGWVLPCK